MQIDIAYRGVGCPVGSCKRCASCDEGLEQYCENGFVATCTGPTTDPPGHTLGGKRTGASRPVNPGWRMQEHH